MAHTSLWPGTSCPHSQICFPSLEQGGAASFLCEDEKAKPGSADADQGGDQGSSGAAEQRQSLLVRVSPSPSPFP